MITPEPAQPRPDGARYEQKLTVAFINADLASRVGLDVRKSIVLYDRNFLFNYALDRLPSERTLRKLYQQTPVRYWSRGV